VTSDTHPQSDYLTVSDVAHVLGLSRMTVYRMCQAGSLPHIRTGLSGKTYRIPRAAFEDYQRTAAPTAGPTPVIPGQTEIPA
jgi:excisionase family DNA binding protein